jgi:hypothetical protein
VRRSRRSKRSSYAKRLNTRITVDACDGLRQLATTKGADRRSLRDRPRVSPRESFLGAAKALGIRGKFAGLFCAHRCSCVLKGLQRPHARHFSSTQTAERSMACEVRRMGQDAGIPGPLHSECTACMRLNAPRCDRLRPDATWQDRRRSQQSSTRVAKCVCNRMSQCQIQCQK